MKKKFTLLMLVASVSGATFAQGEMDAFNYSYNDLKGTARSVSMGGAFGALGGDISSIVINPAGIGVYKSSEIVTTLNFSNNKTETNLTNQKTKDSKFNISFDNIAFVGTVPINSDIAPLINFGFSYNRLKTFNRKIGLNGFDMRNSQTNYIANRVNGIGNGDLSLNNNPFDRGTDYTFGGLAYNTGLIQNTANSNNQYESTLNGITNPSLDNYLGMEEKGSIDTYDFNVGTTFSDMLSIGATVSVTDLNYRLHSLYAENWYSGDQSVGGYDMENFLRTDGTGWQVKVGAIFKPIQELRIGVAYHSPTWYQMTDNYAAGVISDINKTNKKVYTDEYYHDYDFRTPDKWTFSLAGVIAQQFILSADYELTNYKNMHLKDAGGAPYTLENSYIKSDYKNTSTLRVGAEARITPQFSARVGYMWQQSPFQKSFKEANEMAIDNSSIENVAQVAGTATQYAIVGDSNYITWGLGYKFTPNFYTDVAFVIKDRKDDLYTYARSEKAELKNNIFSGVLTLGYRF